MDSVLFDHVVESITGHLSRRMLEQNSHIADAHWPQLYRLLDQTNYRKSVDQLPALLQELNCDVDLVVRTKTA